MVTYQPEDPVLPGNDTVDPFPADLPLVDRILRRTQYLHALLLLVAFLSTAAWYSVYNSKDSSSEQPAAVKGPGGKPLPITKKKPKEDGERKIGPHFGRTAKNYFRLLALVVLLCYIIEGIAMFRHAFQFDNPYRWSRDGLAWAGEWSMVSHCVAPLSVIVPVTTLATR